MARRPFILVAGQSNATPVADAQSWEDEHRTIALRSPRNPVSSAQQFSRASGTSSDKLTLPITFAGGPTRGQFGNQGRGYWQTADCQGKAVQQLRLLTFYNPTASYLNLGTGTTQTFPGVAEIGFFSTGRIINSSVRWHYSPNGKTITRLRTGFPHVINHGLSVTSVNAGTDTITITPAAAPADKLRFLTGDPIHFTGTTAPGGLLTNTTYYAVTTGTPDTTFQVATTEANAKAGTVINLDATAPVACSVHLGPAIATSTFSVYPPFVPPPEAGEQFTYPIWDAGGSTTTLLNLGPAFGGLHDLGSTQDATPYAATAGAHYASMRRVYTGTGITGPARITCKARPVMPGQVLQFGNLQSLSPTELQTITAVDTGGNKITGTSLVGGVPTLGEFTRRFGDGVPITFVNGGGSLPPELAFDTRYFTRNSVAADDSFCVSLAPDGPIIDLSAGWAGTVFISHLLGASPVLSDYYYVTRVIDDEETVTGGVFDDGSNYITFATAHGLTQGERIRLSATTFPVELNGTTDYYVRVVSATSIELAATFGGAAINFSAGGTVPVITRKEWYGSFYVSLEPGGSELEVPGNSGAGLVIYILQAFRGSLTGLVLTCTSGANAGEQRDLADIYLGGSPLRAIVVLNSALPSTPTLGDTYSIAPPPHNGADVAYDKFALWLPWSPFEGQAYQYGPVTSAVQEVAPSPGNPGYCFIDTSGGALLSVGDVVRMYSAGSLPTIFEPGKRYYVVEVGLGGGSAFLSTTYGGSPIVGASTGGGTGTHVITVERQRGRTNPFPPGFNYPNHLQIIGSYQPFDGQALLGPPKQVFYTGLGLRLAEYLGETVYVAACAFGGTGIGHRELSTASGVSYGALDLSQQMSWDPGEPNGCFARLLATLDAAKIAFDRQGDTGECVGIWWVQGEEDATYEDQANRYYENATRLRAAMRQAIKDRDLCSGPADRIRWIQPLPQTTFGQYYATVRAAITKMVDEDPYSATHELTDLERMDVLLDPYHYSGSGMTEFERRSYTAWLGLQRNSSDDVALCNLALSYIGNKATVTSIDPPDGSVEAARCADFFDLALRAVLRMHPWTFATEKTALVLVNTDDAVNDDSAYAYRYELPPDCVHPIAVVHAEAANDAMVAGVKVPADFVVKRSTADKAQRLYTNQEDAYLRYVAYESDSSQWDPLFKIVFTWHLASMLAGALIKSQEGDQAAQRCLARMAQYLAEAKKADFQEQQVTLSEKSKYTRAR